MTLEQKSIQLQNIVFCLEPRWWRRSKSLI